MRDIKELIESIINIVGSDPTVKFRAKASGKVENVGTAIR